MTLHVLLAWLTPERLALCLLAGILGAIAVEAYIAWEARQPWRIEDSEYDDSPLWRTKR